MVTLRQNSIDDILVYSRIERDLRRRLTAGEWVVGQAFPSRRALAEQYDAALGTIEHAIAGLLSDGLLKVVDGRGTFVAQLTPCSPAASDAPALPKAVDAAIEVSPPVQTAVIGIVLQETEAEIREPHRAAEWNPVTIRAIERTLAATGGRTMLQTIGPSDAQGVAMLRTAVESIYPQTVDGLIFLDFDSEPDVLGRLLASRGETSIPLVVITWGDVLCQIPHLFFDNRYMGYQAASHLMQAGYTRLVYLAPHPNTWSEERYVGIQSAVAQCADPRVTLTRFACATPYTGQMSLNSYEQLNAAQFLAAPPFSLRAAGQTPGLAGIITSNDGMALNFLQQATQAGLTVGHDYGLIGFDHRPFAREIGLSSLYPPLERMGEESVHLLYRMLQGDHPPVQTRLRAELVPRLSTLRR